MKNGITKSGTIHIFTDNNECICDLNIKLINKISDEYVKWHLEDCCKNCKAILKRNTESDIIW